MKQEIQAVQKRWITYEEATELYGYSRWTFWRLAREGCIRKAKMAHGVRLDADSIDRYFDALADASA